MNTETKNKVFDVVLTEALKDYMDVEIQNAYVLEKAGSFEFSAKFKKAVNKIKRSIGRIDKIKLSLKIAFKTVVSVAVTFSIVFAMLLTQPAVYAAVERTIRNVFEKYDRIEFTDKVSADFDFNNNIRLGYVPEGFYLSEGVYSPVDVTLTYTNGNDRITFDYSIADGLAMYIDNEHHEYEYITYEEIDYHYYRSTADDFPDVLVWYENGYAFVISAHLSESELVKIAENKK